MTDMQFVTDSTDGLIFSLQINIIILFYNQVLAFNITIGMLVARLLLAEQITVEILLNLAVILKEDIMKSSIRDKAEGTYHELKGKAKEVAGKLSDNPKLQVSGVVEKIAGKVQGKIGQVKKVIGK
jgi:uncharacterized protein YjbJ (UPF0337 family)